MQIRLTKEMIKKMNDVAHAFPCSKSFVLDVEDGNGIGSSISLVTDEKEMNGHKVKIMIPITGPEDW